MYSGCSTLLDESGGRGGGECMVSVGKHFLLQTLWLIIESTMTRSNWPWCARRPAHIIPLPLPSKSRSYIYSLHTHTHYNNTTSLYEHVFARFVERREN